MEFLKATWLQSCQSLVLSRLKLRGVVHAWKTGECGSMIVERRDSASLHVVAQEVVEEKTFHKLPGCCKQGCSLELGFACDLPSVASAQQLKL